MNSSHALVLTEHRMAFALEQADVGIVPDDRVSRDVVHGCLILTLTENDPGTGSWEMM